MNLIDLLLIVVVILSVWTGWRKGFILGALDLAGWLGSVLAGFLLYRYLGSFFAEHIPALGVWVFPVAFIAIILLARIIFSVVIRTVLRVTPEERHRSTSNQLMGIIPGAMNGAINITILLAILLAFPLPENISNSARNSIIAKILAHQVAWVDSNLSPIFDEAIRKSISNLTVEPGSNETVTLDYTVLHPKTRTDLEATMLNLVNEERAKMGLQPLKSDPEMTQVARAHSRDMFARGYFSHETPNGKTLADRVRAANISFLTAGENLALGPTLSICHEGLMNSPGHKANILHRSYGRLGIGILDGGKYGLMITQNFRN